MPYPAARPRPELWHERASQIALKVSEVGYRMVGTTCCTGDIDEKAWFMRRISRQPERLEDHPCVDRSLRRFLHRRVALARFP
jgi:hypothetical protein